MADLKRTGNGTLLLVLILGFLAPSAARAEPYGETPVVAGYKGGFFLKTEDARFRLSLGGRVTSHAWIYQQDSTPDSDLFLTRARVWISACVWEHFEIRIQNEFLSGTSLRDAYLDIDYTPRFRFRIGQFKVPFSLEELASHKYIDFVERPAIVQGSLRVTRDTGVMIHGQLIDTLLQYQMALLSGAGQNTKDNNAQKDVAGRVMVSPFSLTDLSLLRGLSLGLAATYGRQPALSARNSISGSTPDGFTFYDAIPVKGDRVRLDAQLAWPAGPAAIKGEYIRTSEDREGIEVDGQTGLDPFETDGWYLSASWVLTGEDQTFSRPTPASLFLDSNGSPGPGLVKLSMRYEVFSLDKARKHAMTEPGPITFRALTAGVTWYPASLLRLSADYQWQRFSDTARAPRPGHKDEHLVMLRFQAEF